MSDINALAQQLSQIITPFIPYLVKGGIEAGKSAAGKIGELATEKGWDKAQALWSKISGHSDVKKAAETLAKLPEDADALAALRLQIKLVLDSNADLVAAIENLLSEHHETRHVSTQGSRSITIGGNSNNSVIITGDNNKVEK